MRSARPATLGERIARRAVRATLGRIREGVLVIRDGAAEHRSGSPATDGLSAVVTVHDPRFYTTVLYRGGLGAGEAYVDGHWSADDLTSVVRLLARNRDALETMRGGARRIGEPVLRALAGRRRNTRAGSRRNIADHYDLSNELFALMLDETMTYSCGVFEGSEATLADASRAKLERICRELDLNPGDHVLEIGTGWGSFALHAAAHYGVQVTTTTISAAQRTWALERVREAGLSDRITVLDRDYRDLEGRYDRVVSIEMIEAIGAEYYETFFRILADRLRPGGRVLVQAITIEDDRFEAARRTVDFIKQHIFPGSCIPSIGALREAMAPSGLEIERVHDITEHYPPTLRAWRANLLHHHDDIRALGYDDRFLRAWLFYLCYCEGGFMERRIGTVQMTLSGSGR
jgi:cyclopropane-fatty-acyl-phospholipid synthase